MWRFITPNRIACVCISCWLNGHNQRLFFCVFHWKYRRSRKKTSSNRDVILNSHQMNCEWRALWREPPEVRLVSLPITRLIALDLVCIAAFMSSSSTSLSVECIHPFTAARFLWISVEGPILLINWLAFFFFTVKNKAFVNIHGFFPF